MNLPWRICMLIVPLLLSAASAAADFRAEVVRQQSGNLRLTSVLAPDGDPYPGTQFSVLRTEPDAFGRTRFTQIAAAGPQAYADFQLSPGRYVVQARNGTVTVEQPVDVPAHGVGTAQIVLDAGELHLGSVMDASGRAAPQTWFRVWRDETDPYGRPSRVQVAGNGYSQTASFLLPAGDYLAEASYGDATIEAAVKIRAGQISSHELVLDAGELELFSTLGAGGEPLADTTFSIYRRSPGQATWTEVTRVERAQTITFVLPQGEYRARAELDLASVELPVSVTAGEAQVVELPLQAGELLLYTTLAGQADPLPNTRFGLRTQPEAGSDPTLSEQSARGPAHSARYIVPAGRYLALASLGESEQSAPVEIAAGDRQTLPIGLDAARVTLSLVRGDGHTPYPYGWFSVYRIERDPQGSEWRRRVFNAGYYAQTDVVLPAGEYIAFARSDDHRGEDRFALAPGAVKVLPIVAEPRQ